MSGCAPVGAPIVEPEPEPDPGTSREPDATAEPSEPDAGGTEPPPAEPHRPSMPPATACPDVGPAGPTTAAGFDHATSGIWGEARHQLTEPVVTLGERILLETRFRYGLASKDLEDEEVTTYVRFDPCGDWTELGTLRTDDDGLIVMAVDPSRFEEVGSYEVEIVALGDLSRARGYIHIVPWGQPSIVFDIDGTLTTSDSELFGELYDGVPAEMYEGGPDVAWLYAEAGYFIVYLTGRPHMLQEMSRAWLETHGFPLGPVITSDHLLEASGPLVEQHKREHLAMLRGQGLDFTRAYGNATTDICAYAESSIDPARTYVIGAHGGEACEGYAPTVAVESYPAHLSSMEPPPPAWE
jgi:hypothetical protein